MKDLRGAPGSAENKAQSEASTAARVESLDYLRGLLAVAVMVYHYASWAGGDWNAGTFLGRMGIYAVSMFYVLSGLSLMLVYRHRLHNAEALRQYAIHRTFRIVPLFWLVVSLSLLLTLAPAILKGVPWPEVDAWRVFLNYSLLFGFLQPGAYYSTGAWSIGNEVVFYALFPMLVVLGSRSRAAFGLAAALSLGVAAWFAAAIDPSQPLAISWSTYINPLNQLPFFIAGMWIALWGGAGSSHTASLGILLLAAGIVMFLVHPADGHLSALVALDTRPYFLIACSLIVLGVYRANALLVRIPGLGKGLGPLGAWTYSIYLLHPFAPVVTKRVFENGWLSYGAAAAITIGASWVSYRLLELPMMRMGKRVALKIPSTETFARSTP